ncbi:MAG: sodium-dependent transporter [Planctomycetota bacterium]|nr:MAG: sodium-dependent transporter [Planctomycetota bacterium]
MTKTVNEPPRAQWKSKFGFILAASGSAIGLGNIVFFPANAYAYGGGAFYLPYFIALFLIGIPVMIAEFGIGAYTRRSFPLAMRQVGGAAAEFAGWFAILNASFITMYYITILGWGLGTLFGALGDSTGEVLFGGETFFASVGEGGVSKSNPEGFFYALIRSWQPVLFVVVVWLLNVVLVSRGTKTIEFAVKIFVPTMWLAMIGMIVIGLSQEGGIDGVMFLFTPEMSVLRKPEVWQGAMSQMFFTLSLGFGVMSAYASYLPKRSDHTHNAITTSLLNCGFEWVAGVAIFSMLFAFAIEPEVSTLAMMFFIVPKGIGSVDPGFQVIGVAFFFLLLIAGLTSSISLVEALVSGMQDKFRLRRSKTLMIAVPFGLIGSVLFALPVIVNSQSAGGVLGLTLLDLIDHWSFGYGLLIVGLVECVVLGWVVGPRRIREHINKNSRFHLGAWFDVLITFVIPALILGILVWNVWNVEIQNGLYGSSNEYDSEGGLLGSLHYLAIGVWLLVTCGGGLLLTRAKGEEGSHLLASEEGGR